MDAYEIFLKKILQTYQERIYSGMSKEMAVSFSKEDQLNLAYFNQENVPFYLDTLETYGYITRPYIHGFVLTEKALNF